LQSGVDEVKDTRNRQKTEQERRKNFVYTREKNERRGKEE
jgi:hypothetical protein